MNVIDYLREIIFERRENKKKEKLIPNIEHQKQKGGWGNRKTYVN